MDTKALTKELKLGILDMIKTTFDTESKDIKNEVTTILKKSEERLARWTVLLSKKQLSKDEFKWLLQSQRDLYHMATLRALGISQIKLGHFKSKALNFVASTVFKFVGL